MGLRVGSNKINGVKVVGEKVNKNVWVRPSDWPDYDSLDISNEDAIYFTYKTKEENSFFAIRVYSASTGNAFLKIGTIENGAFVEKSSEAISPPSSGLVYKDLQNYTEDYIVVKMIGVNNFHISEGVNGLTSYTNVHQGFQYCLEIYGRSSSLTTLNNTFRGIRYARSITLFNITSVTSLERVAGDCNSLENFYIDGTVSSCSMYFAFAQSKMLNYVHLGNVKPTNMSSAFVACPILFNDAGSWDLSGVTDFSSAFNATKGISSIDLSTGTNNIGLNATFRDSNIRKVSFDGREIVGTMANAFMNSCVAEIPDADYSGVTNFNSAFQGSLLHGIIDVSDMPITEISGTFSYCSGITELYLPNTITSITASSFRDTQSCYEIHLPVNIPPSLAYSNAFTTNTNPNLKIYVPYAADHSVLTAYQTATNWSSLSSKIVEEPA